MSADLEQLLTDADATATSPVERIGNMGERVRSIARRRRNACVFASAAASLVVALSVLFALRPQFAGPVVRDDAPPPSPDAVEEVIAALDAEADARMAIVERLVAAEHHRALARRSRAPDPLLAVRREQDQAAYMLIYEADRIAQKRSERARATEKYRRVLALFPETHWASLARERLVELNGASRRSAPDPLRDPGTTEGLS
jgi:hypothetical protein